MESSGYQNLKLVILEILHLSKDAIHIHVGLIIFCLGVVIWRRGRLDYMNLLPVFITAGAMEFLDLRDDLVSFGHIHWASSAHDVINTVLWPTIIVLTCKHLKIQKNL